MSRNYTAITVKACVTFSVQWYSSKMSVSANMVQDTIISPAANEYTCWLYNFDHTFWPPPYTPIVPFQYKPYSTHTYTAPITMVHQPHTNVASPPLPFASAISTGMRNEYSLSCTLAASNKTKEWLDIEVSTFHLHPALMALTTSDRPNSVSHHNPSFGTYHLNRQLKSNHKTFLFPLSSTQRHAPFPLQLISFFHHNW